jgi:hypothetical protein
VKPHQAIHFHGENVVKFFTASSSALTAPVMCMCLHCWECRLCLSQTTFLMSQDTRILCYIIAHLLCNKYILVAKPNS